MAITRNPIKVQHYIDDALQHFSGLDSSDKELHAWAYLRGMRRLGDDDLCRRLNMTVPRISDAPEDPNLADAEHYMYARFLASSSGDVSTKALVLGYEVVKVLTFQSRQEKDLRTDSRFPVLPPSRESVRWGLKGVDAGLEEFKKAHNGGLGKFGSAIDANREFANGQYKRAYSPQRAYRAK